MKHTLKWTIPLLIAACLPLVLLFFPITSNFCYDWYSHLGALTYHSEYFRVHHSMPYVVNASYALFIPQPIFYSYLLHPVFGVLGAYLGPNLALRIPILLSWLFQIFFISKLLRKLGADLIYSSVITILVMWAIYPMTNIYNRAALPEAIGTGALFSAVCIWYLIIFTDNIREKIKLTFFLTMSLWLAWGIHPITTAYGGLFFVASVGLSLPPLWKSKTKMASLICLMITAILSSIPLLQWVYATFSFLHNMNMTHGASQGASGTMGFYPNDIDSWRTRFAFFPFDKRSLIAGGRADSPYLDTQMNMPLLLFLMGQIIISGVFKIRHFKRHQGFILFGGSLFLFAISSWMSLSPVPFGLLPPIAEIIQFVYRMISYQNLSILMTMAGLIWMAPKAFQNPKKNPLKMIILVFALTLSFSNLIIKMERAKVLRNKGARAGTIWSLNDHDKVLDEHYTHWDYLSPQIPQLDSNLQTTPLNFPVLGGDRFGETPEIEVNSDQSKWYLTNIVAFGWNSISLDDKLYHAQDLHRVQGFLALEIPQGKHKVTPLFTPDPIWLTLHSFGLYLISGVVILGTALLIFL